MASWPRPRIYHHLHTHTDTHTLPHSNRGPDFSCFGVFLCVFFPSSLCKSHFKDISFKSVYGERIAFIFDSFAVWANLNVLNLCCKHKQTDQLCYKELARQPRPTHSWLPASNQDSGAGRRASHLAPRATTTPPPPPPPSPMARIAPGLKRAEKKGRDVRDKHTDKMTKYRVNESCRDSNGRLINDKCHGAPSPPHRTGHHRRLFNHGETDVDNSLSSPATALAGSRHQSMRRFTNKAGAFDPESSAAARVSSFRLTYMYVHEISTSAAIPRHGSRC